LAKGSVTLKVTESNRGPTGPWRFRLNYRFGRHDPFLLSCLPRILPCLPSLLSRKLMRKPTSVGDHSSLSRCLLASHCRLWRLLNFGRTWFLGPSFKRFSDDFSQG